MQSLGKVPTARRAPVNLPSEKSENGGNDPSVVLVPSGGGWANKEGKKEAPVDPRGGGGRGQEQGQTTKPPAGGDVAANQSKQGSPPSSKSGPKSWSSVTGSGQSPGLESVRQKNFHQKLF